MDELNRHNNKEYAYLRQIPIDKLLELLAVAPVLSTCPEDEAYVDALEEAIIEKEEENPTGFFPDVDQQWEQFATYYLPVVDEAAFEPERVEHAVSEQTNQQTIKVPPKRVIWFRQARRTILIASAAFACVFSIMVMAQAAGADVFGAMARWTEDVFSFGCIPPDSVVSECFGANTGENRTERPDSEREFSSLQTALDTYGITEIHEPVWLPDGYALDAIDVTYWDDPLFLALNVSYTDGNDYINVSIKIYDGEPSMQVQKTDSSVEIIEQHGITFYLIENSESYIVAWCAGQYEYYINGKLDKDILWEVASSMYK